MRTVDRRDLLLRDLPSTRMFTHESIAYEVGQAGEGQSQSDSLPSRMMEGVG
jgi:hypothetical protein